MSSTILTNYIDFRTWFGNVFGATLANDNLKAWPYEAIINRPFSTWVMTFPLTIIIPGSASTDWYWYLMLPNEGSGFERFSLTPHDHFNTIIVGRTAYGLTSVDTNSASSMNTALRDVFLFAKDTDNELIYCVDLHRSAFATA